MPESTEAVTETTTAPKKRGRPRKDAAPPSPPPMVDFSEDLPTAEPVQDEPEEIANSAEPVAPAGGTPAPEPVVTTHLSPFLVGMAKGFGLSEAELKDMSQKEVERFIEFAHRRDSWIAQNVLGNQSNPGERQGAAVTPSAAPAPDPEIDIGLSDEYPQEIRDAIKKAYTAKDAEIKELKAMITDLHGQAKTRQQKELHAAFDEAFVELGEPYEEYYGKGTLTQEQQLKRQFVTMAIAEDDSPVDAKKKIHAITKLLYGNGKVKAPEPAPVNPAIEEAKKNFSESTVAKPIQRDPAKEPYGVARATKSVSDLLRKQGKHPSYTNGEVEETKL